MSVTLSPFGVTRLGEPVTAYRLENTRNMSAVVLDYGCTLQSLLVPDRQGRPVDVVLGYDSIEAYEQNDGYLGAAIGRVGNRIGGGRFLLGGMEHALACNDGANHLHGGVRGFDKYVWSATPGENCVRFSRLSADGEEGYPGALAVSVTYTLTDQGALVLDYDAQSSRDTLVNLTNHSYFNLNGGGTVLEHLLQVSADSFCENDTGCLPTGTMLSVVGTPFDFRTPKPIGQDIGLPHIQLKNAGGYDHNFALNAAGRQGTAAVLESATTGIRMSVETTLPGIQVYSGNFLTSRAGKGGQAMGFREGLCLETQVHPDAIHHPAFPSAVLPAGQRCCTQTVYCFQALPV